jgi:hypothetical protein
MEGLLVEALAAEKDRDRQRQADSHRLARRFTRKPRRPAGSWVLSGSMATWLGR